MLGKEAMSIDDARRLPPLVLAYLGDAVLELYVRTRLVGGTGTRPEVLHRQAVSRVKAAAQATALRRVMAELTPEEQDIVRRGRNAKTSARRADPADYHYSTAFEALLGFLYLTGQEERLLAIMAAAYAEPPGITGERQPDDC